MPAVQSAFGPIVEPGWPELKTPDLAAGFLSGFQIAANANAKQRQLENQLAHYALRAQSDAADRELDQKRYQLSVERLQQQSDYKDQALDLQARGMDLRDTKVQLAVDKYNDTQAANKAVYDGIQSLRDRNIGPDDPRYPEEFLRVTEVPGADPRVIQNERKSHITDYATNAWRQNVTLNQRRKMLLEDMGSKLYGDPNLHFTGPIEDPSQYPEEKTGGGSEFWKWFTGKPYGEGEAGKPTGYRTGTITLPSGETKEVKFKTSDLTEFTKKWKALQADEAKRLPLVDMPGLGIHSQPTTNANERARRIVDDETETPERRAQAQFWLDQHPEQ